MMLAIIAVAAVRFFAFQKAKQAKVTLAGGESGVKLPVWLPAYARATMQGLAGEGEKGAGGVL